MITQKDVHNAIAENVDPYRKAIISHNCDGDSEKIKRFEQTVADILNGIIKSIQNSGTDYLNQKQ